MTAKTTERVDFSLLTFNCFGGLSWTMPRRLYTLARKLNNDGPTVVCLQEVQTYWALRILLRACSGYPQHAFAPGFHAPRGALLILARTALRMKEYDRFHTQGPWHGLTIMDRITQKGALLTTLTYAGLPINVINTHLLANYRADWREASHSARDQHQQLQQLATLVRAQPAEALVLVAGDFNIPRGSWLYDDFLGHSGLRDTLAGDARPTYRPFAGIPQRYALPIDFVFVRTPQGMAIQVETAFRFAEKLPLVIGGRGYLSDHVGVQVKLSWPAQVSSTAHR